MCCELAPCSRLNVDCLGKSAPFFQPAYKVGRARTRGVRRSIKGSFFMFRRLVLAGLALVAAGAVSVAQAQDLVGIATETLDLSKDGSASIDVSKANGAFRAVRVKNQGKGVIDLSRVQIVYSDEFEAQRGPSDRHEEGRTQPRHQRDQRRQIHQLREHHVEGHQGHGHAAGARPSDEGRPRQGAAGQAGHG